MELKLYYIHTSAGLKADSVQKKVIAQIKAFNDCGINCRGAFFTQDVQAETRLNEHIVLVPYPATHKKYFNVIYQKRELINKVSKYISETIGPGEYIYLRYPFCSNELYRFAKSNNGRIISEHQVKEIDEIRSFRNEHPLGLNLSKLISYFLYQIWPVYNELRWSGPYSRHLKAKVAVTNEIAEFHRKNCKNVWVIPNGIDASGINIRKVPLFGDELRILFLKGTSELAPWNGLDRLIRSIDSYQSKDVRIQLIICGNVIPGEIPDREYILQKGFMDSEELDRMFSIVHIGFSTLCLYRKNLKEAAVLKAREYFARGLPFVYAYGDPDIKETDDINRFLLRLPNDDSIIDFNQVLAFAKTVSSDLSHPLKMRAFSEENLDWKVKMNKLKDYLLTSTDSQLK